MRSFTLSIFATLAFAVFSFAAPLAAPVNAVVARHDDHSEDVSLEIVLQTCIDVITPITQKLTCLTEEDATVDVVVGVLVELQAAVETVTVKVNALASLPLDRILCTLVGGVLDAVAIANFLACLLNLVFGAFVHVLIVVSVSVKAEILSQLVEIGCLVGTLLCAVLGLVSNLVASIVVCLLPQILGIIPCINVLGITSITGALNI